MLDNINSFDELNEEQQNQLLGKYLIEVAKYLEPKPFPNSPGFFFYQALFKDQKFHGNSVVALAKILLLLVDRDYIWPIKFNNGNPIHLGTGTQMPYYVFTYDIINLNDIDGDSFEYFDLDEASTSMNN